MVAEGSREHKVGAESACRHGEESMTDTSSDEADFQAEGRGCYANAVGK